MSIDEEVNVKSNKRLAKGVEMHVLVKEKRIQQEWVRKRLTKAMLGLEAVW